MNSLCIHISDTSLHFQYPKLMISMVRIEWRTEKPKTFDKYNVSWSMEIWWNTLFAIFKYRININFKISTLLVVGQCYNLLLSCFEWSVSIFFCVRHSAFVLTYLVFCFVSRILYQSFPSVFILRTKHIFPKSVIMCNTQWIACKQTPEFNILQIQKHYVNDERWTMNDVQSKKFFAVELAQFLYYSMHAFKEIYAFWIE